jgi:hypothetical protein
MLNFGGRLGQPKKTKLILFLFNRWWIFDFETDYTLFNEFMCKLGFFGMSGPV